MHVGFPAPALAAVACSLSLASILHAHTPVDPAAGLVHRAPAPEAVPAAQPPVPGDATEVDPLQNVDVLSFTDDKRLRMAVPVSVDGQGPYRFLVDTGAERTVISRQLAERLSLGPGRDVRIHSMTGAVRVETALVPELQISTNKRYDIHAPRLEAAHLGAAGMLGVDTLQDHRVTFDFTRKTMSIVPSEKRPERYGPDVIVVTGRRLHGRLILTDARIEGEKVTVVIDTGAEMSIGNEALRRRLERKRKLRNVTPVTLLSVTGDSFQVDYTTIRRVALGELVIQHLPIGFKDVHPFKRMGMLDRPAILLGMDALRLFEQVSVDFERRQVRFFSSDLAKTGLQMSGRSDTRRPL